MQPLRCQNCHADVVVADDATPGQAVCSNCGSAVSLDSQLTVPSDDANSLKRIGRFELLDSIGCGAYGEVYRARDPMLGRLVAVKIPRLHDLATKTEVERFLREARSMAQLRHPGIVPVHEVGYANGIPYLVSELIEGVNLSDRLSAGPMPARQAATLVATIADALAYAHQHGVIHRDVKPSNIMIDSDGRARLMDFGMAKRESADATMTSDGEVLGSPAYMPPEQARGESHLVDGRSDLYSLGVVLFQLLAGELPFRGNARMVLHQVLHDTPPSPRLFNDKVPRDMATICLKAMNKEPDQRYASAAEMAADLRRFLDGLAVRARPIGMAARSWLWCHRADRLRDAGAVAVFIGVMLCAWTCYDILHYTLISPPPRPLQAVLQRLILIGGFFVPIILVGLGTLKRHGIAVAMGIFYGLAGMSAALLFRFQERLGLNFDLGGTYTHPETRVSIAALFSILSLVLGMVYGIAAIAFAANRNALRWYRAADPGTSTATSPRETRI